MCSFRLECGENKVIKNSRELIGGNHFTTGSCDFGGVMRNRIFLLVILFVAFLDPRCLHAQQIGSRSALNLLLGSNQVLEDFEAYQITDGTSEVLNVPSVDSLTVANGQGPSLVKAGATYSHPFSGTVQWNGDDYFTLESKTFFTGFDLDIIYDPNVNAMGVDLQAFSGFEYTATVSVFDLDDNLIFETTNFAVSSTTSEFFGYQHAPGIGRVRLADDSNAWSPVIDNHSYGLSVPEPGSVAVLVCYAVGFSLKRRRRDS